MSKKVVIIGAGPAGLTAGYELLKQHKDYEVLILEAEAQVGGIARTIKGKEMNFDIGGHRYFTNNPKILQWWKEMLDEKEFVSVKRFSDIVFQGKLYRYPVELNSELFKNLGFRYGIRILASFVKSQLWKRDINTLEDVYVSLFGEKLYELFFKDYTKKVWGREAQEILPDWGYQRVGGISLSSIIKNGMRQLVPYTGDTKMRSLTDRFYYPKHGSGVMWEKAATRIVELGGQIRLNSPVETIEIVGNSIVQLKCRNGDAVQADYVISSMPIIDLVRGFSSVPKRILAKALSLPYRNFVYVSIVIPTSAILNSFLVTHKGTLVPDQWLYIQEKNIGVGRIQILDNWSAELNDNNAVVHLGMEYFCDNNDLLWNMSDYQWSDKALDDLRSLGVLSSNYTGTLSEVFRCDKAYPGYWDGYESIDEIKRFLSGIKNLYCIGRNGQHKYNNMDHAMETAFAAVKCIVGNVENSKLWEVNGKAIYNEAKNEK